MSRHPLPPCPKGPYSITQQEDGTILIIDSKGNPVIGQDNGAERLVDCANALQKIWHPEPHIKTLTAQVDGLEQLRKAAWARVQELETELASLKNREGSSQ